ncbi:MAG TPA: hypothetical protein VEI97_05100 [bacterium]|nr:hypothetical protein [bacterium]
MAKQPPPCPRCNSENTKEDNIIENSYGELITEYRCKDCGHEWDSKVSGTGT